MGKAELVKDIRIFVSHVRYNYISDLNLAIDPIENPLGVDLLIHPFRNKSLFFGNWLDAHLVDVVKLAVERHENEAEGLRVHRVAPQASRLDASLTSEPFGSNASVTIGPKCSQESQYVPMRPRIKVGHKVTRKSDFMFKINHLMG